MPTVELRFRALPAHVRTARLVAVVLARRAGLPDEVLDEVRQAVGEACSRAVDVHNAQCPDTLVSVRLHDDAGRLLVEVSDCGPGDLQAEESALQSLASAADPGAPGSLGEVGAAQIALALLSGLVDDLTLHQRGAAYDDEPTGLTDGQPPAGPGLTVAMSWAAPPG